jgi:hypothetical protein
MNGRIALLSIILIMVALIGISFSYYGYETTWRLWNIPTLMPPFMDLRMLSGGAESFRAGFDPIHSNPGDPLGRPFNLPFAWHFVFHTGIEQSDTIWIGALLAGGYLFCAWVFSRPLDLPIASLIGILLFSPASMLAVERGNVDLFIFMLCTITLLLLEKHTWLASAILMVAAFLKLYPIFGLAIFLREVRSRFQIISLSALAVFLIYAILTYPSMAAAFAYTEVGAEVSYGVNVVPLYLERLFRSEQLFALFTLIFSLVGLALFLSAFYFGSKEDSLPVNESSHLSAFRLGAMLYVGTFLLGNNWDYRMIFLIFTAPQLVRWATQSSARKPAGWTLAAMVIACWYLISSSMLGSSSTGTYAVYIVDQISKWGIFVGLCYLFFASAPQWLRAEINKTLESGRHKFA